ncbi:hypothetical protein [Leptospira ilyithenensis]|uniref:Uncharacterized protein n=1 Tax=Leptospira ilyithenensis TaxID=2484901 RepID=A0A4R9LRL7_9LEPT|nr:hypothetical protein [Leptospira ilyithenensis]TGN09777.1 hypothetical protein EHS11_11890 [Leptospira ilyithenensis]
MKKILILTSAFSFVYFIFGLLSASWSLLDWSPVTIISYLFVSFVTTDILEAYLNSWRAK